MNRILTYNITEDWPSIRDFLNSKLYPHAVFVRLKKTENSVLVNGEWLHLYQPLHAGDTLEIRLIEKENSDNIVPRDFSEIMHHVKCEPGAHSLPDEPCAAGAHSLPVIYEDEDILVVNKPAGLPIHPSQNHYEDSLANAVMAYYKEQGENFVFRCINRLDRNTSGLTLIAKNMLSSAILSQDVMKRDIHRTYLALVERKEQERSEQDESVSQQSAQQLPDSGTIEAPIARAEGSTILREVNFETGDYALTKYWKLADFEDATLLKLQLGTGRTHQIRVHMSYIGHPLLGDDLYGNGTYQQNDAEGKPIILDRHALHSYRLEFTHPITGEAMDLRADLPIDMGRIVGDLSKILEKA
jgi:23S rRNA pseudouridine1911/1915/1917 synthase